MLELRLDLQRADFSLKVDEQLALPGITAIFGPSGAGKSTLLRAIAGFEQPTSGKIVFAGTTWFDAHPKTNLPPEKRPAGYMFQDGRLFPHLNVMGNLRYAARRSHPGGPQLGFEDVVEAADLGALLGRDVSTLSGGEAQRVALARTLLRRPKLLLLDEPLSALDRERKLALLPYLKDLPKRFGIPALYVSHAIDEVARLADDVLVLAQGRVQAKGPTVETLEAFDLEPITGRFEAGVLRDAQIIAHSPEQFLTHVESGGVQLVMPLLQRLEIGAHVRLRIRARDVALATTPPEGISIRNILPARITHLRADHNSGFVDIVMSLGEGPLRARITRASVSDLKLEVGQSVYALIKSISFDRRMV